MSNSIEQLPYYKDVFLLDVVAGIFCDWSNMKGFGSKVLQFCFLGISLRSTIFSLPSHFQRFTRRQLAPVGLSLPIHNLVPFGLVEAA